MTITTDRLLIRPFRLSDAQDAFAYRSRPEVGNTAGWRAHTELCQTEALLSEWSGDENCLALVYKDSGHVIGHITVQPDSEEGRADTRELGCALSPDYQRKGLMTEAMRAVTEQLFSQGIDYLWVCCFQGNIASKRMIEKCGYLFQQEGEYDCEELGQTFKTYEYRLSRQEWEAAR